MTTQLEIDGRGVATLTVNRPEKHNALNAAIIAELTDAAAKLDRDGSVRAVVLRGAGESFCAGGDLEWMKAQFAASRTQRMAEARALANMLRAMNTLGKPLIAAVNGTAMGGGVGLLSTCDHAIAVDTARFGLTETRLGLIPATIGPYVVAKLSEGRARRIFMSARVFGAAQAAELGLVDRVVAASELEVALEDEIVPYLAAAPGAVSAAKALLRSLGPRIDDAVIDDTVRRLADTWEQPEAQEGVGAFFAKRTPHWVV